MVRNRIKEKGQTFVEYGIVIAVVACIAIAGLASAGSSINNKVTAMAGSTEEPEPTTAYWGVSTDGVLTLSTKELTASEKSKDGGTIDLTAPIFTADNYSTTTWGKYRDTLVSVNIKDHMAPSNTSYWFCDMSELVTINNIQNLDTSNVTDMSGMFYYCKSLTSLDVSHFNTSNVTNMAWMFSGMPEDCMELKSLDVSHFDTSKVTDMRDMFYGCGLLTSLDVSSFNTSNVTNMSEMFCGCSSLTSLDTSHFVINAGTDTTDMYDGCPAHE